MESRLGEQQRTPSGGQRTLIGVLHCVRPPEQNGKTGRLALTGAQLGECGGQAMPVPHC